MKTLSSFSFIYLIMLFSCSKDFVNDENLQLKKAGTPVPVKGAFCAAPAPDAVPILIQGLPPEDPKSYLPDKILVSGNCTHMGELITEKSWIKKTVCTLLLENSIPYMYEEGIGFMTANNGDGYPITYWVKMSLLTMEYTGEGVCLSGTGRFVGVAGETTMKGKVDMATGSNCWNSTGAMWYEK